YEEFNECVESNCPGEEMECTGEVTLQCSDLDNEYDCIDIQDCGWEDGGEDVCGSQPTVCGELGEDDCGIQVGCNWTQGEGDNVCEGTPNLCSSYGDESNCNLAGCLWEDPCGGYLSAQDACAQSIEGYCYGEPDACSEFDGFESCDIVGCEWNYHGGQESCIGTPEGTCNGEDLEDCEQVLGCDWGHDSDYSCTGDVELECSDLDNSEDCGIIPECIWEAKDPECDKCISTLWQVTDEFEYDNPFTVDESCDHKVCYYSADLLGNMEDEECQVFSVDNTAPEITILNPTQAEAESVEKCIQSVVALVEDDKTGVKEVWAELYDDNDTMVRSVVMRKTVYGTWEALMDKQLPVGEYNLIVKARDNVDNVGEALIVEELVESVFVEYISPAVCEIDPEQGGSCDFTFHVCMRGGNSMYMWMNKLGGVVTPGMMNAMISSGGEETFVGLKHDDFESDAGLLLLSEGCEALNERTTFDLSLELDEDTAGMLGVGNHELEYWLRSGLVACELD
ncbi:MAG: hypothetical protein ABIE22_05225, partial [archaeon]